MQYNVIICCERYYLTKYILEILVLQVALIDIEIEGNAQDLRRYAYSVEQVCFNEHIRLWSKLFYPSRHITSGLILDQLLLKSIKLISSSEPCHTTNFAI